MRWKAALDDYTTYLRLERGLSENSITSYAYDIKAFIAYARNTTHNSALKIAVSRTPKPMYINWLSKSMPRSQARQISGLKSF